MYTMIPGKPALSVLKADERVNIWHGPVRSGKTIHSLIAWVDFVLNAPTTGELFMIGITEDSLERNILGPLAQLCEDFEIFFSYSRGSHTFQIHDRTGWILGAANKTAENKIRGATAAGMYGDELSLWPTEVLNQCLMRLSVAGARFYGTTNPGGPHHPLKKDIIDRASELGYAVFHWAIDANTALDPAYVSNLKKQFTGIWYKRFVMGEWCAAEGAIYSSFDEALHTVKPNQYPRAEFFTAALDYGTSNATSAGLYGIARGSLKIWAQSEYYHSGREEQKSKTDAQYADDLLAWLEEQAMIRTQRNSHNRISVDPACREAGFYQGRKGKFLGIYMDPSAASMRAELQERGMLTHRAVNDVVDGIRTVSTWLENGWYKISTNCTRAIASKGLYVWDSKAQEIGQDKPVKKDDHEADQERYMIHTLASGGVRLPEDAVGFGSV